MALDIRSNLPQNWQGRMEISGLQIRKQSPREAVSLPKVTQLRMTRLGLHSPEVQALL